MTDTGGFTFNSNDPDVFFIISQLLTKHINKDKIYRNVYHNYSEHRLRMVGFVLCNRLVVDEKRHAAYYTLTRDDLRQFHFGVLVGAHLQDLEFINGGPQIITNEDGTSVEKIVTCDQDRWDAGFTVGVLGEFRINQTFQFRVAPAMYFGTRHLTFHNFSDVDATGAPIEQHQEL